MVKWEVYVVKKMEMVNGELLSNFSYTVEASKKFEELRLLWGMDVYLYRSVFVILDVRMVCDDV